MGWIILITIVFTAFVVLAICDSYYGDQITEMENTILKLDAKKKELQHCNKLFDKESKELSEYNDQIEVFAISMCTQSDRYIVTKARRTNELPYNETLFFVQIIDTKYNNHTSFGTKLEHWDLIDCKTVKYITPPDDEEDILLREMLEQHFIESNKAQYVGANPYKDIRTDDRDPF